MSILLSLIGEQPIPNLLPIRHYQPFATLAVHSDKTATAAGRLEKLIASQVHFWPLCVDAYDIRAIQAAILTEIEQRQLAANDLIFNLTGGTKPMSLAAYFAAQALGSPMVYLQTEGKRSRLFCYEFRQGEPTLTENKFLPGLITIDDYLQAYIGRQYGQRKSVPDDEGHRFEQAVAEALRPVLDEMRPAVNLKGSVDVDLIVRCENQVGIVEAKLGKNHMKQAIDQLNTAAGQTFLGTYTQKFLLSDQDWNAYPDLKELASARQITLIELPNSRGQLSLSAENRAKVQQAVLAGLGKPANRQSSI
jgi:hypothetical protein